MKRSMAGLILVLAAVLIAGCGSRNIAGADAGTHASSRLTTVQFAYDWPTPDFGMVPMVAAMSKGYYRAAGIDLKPIFPPDTSTAMKIVGIGQANVGYDTTTDIAFAKQQAVPAISIANVSQSNNWGLVGRPGEKIDVHALRGKSIGIYTDSWTKAMLPFVLQHVGLTENDVKLVTAANDVIPLLLAKKIDVATETSNFGAVEVRTTTGKPATMLLADKVGAPDVPIWNYVANQRYAQQHPNTVRAFLAATKKGMIWSAAHPAAAVRLFEKMYPKNGSSHTYNLDGWEATAKLLKGPHGYLVETPRQWSQLTNALKRVHVLSKVLPPGDYYTNKYQP